MIWKRLHRAPLPALGVLLFAAMLAVALCALQAGSDAAQAHYDEIVHTIEVPCILTNPSGSRSGDLWISDYTCSLFTGEFSYAPDDLVPFTKDLQRKGTRKFQWDEKTYQLVGLNCLRIEPALWPDNGCEITWNPGFDEGLFLGDSPACLIPEKLAARLAEYELESFPLLLNATSSYTHSEDYQGELPIAGVYTGGQENTLYISWNAYAAIVTVPDGMVMADALRMTLKNNDDLDALRQAAAAWFPAPNPYALDDGTLAFNIDDHQLRQADIALQNSLRGNRMAALLIFLLSSGAGFLVGFLMIHTRKREIILMRTVGASPSTICGSFLAEQLLAAAGGIVLGGAAFTWHPFWQLGVFLTVYTVGLSLALLIFLRKNLMVTMKEDE